MKSDREFLNGIYQKAALRKEETQPNSNTRRFRAMPLGALAAAVAAVFCFVMNAARAPQALTPMLTRAEADAVPTGWPWVAGGIILTVLAVVLAVWWVVLRSRHRE